MTPPYYPSASAIELWERCEARALGAYVAGYRSPDTKATLEGKRLHLVTQEFLATGKLPSMQEAAVMRIIGALPVPGGSVARHNIERVLVVPRLFGFTDWQDDFGRQGDLKFTSDVKWQRAKDPTQDPQRLIYAADYFHQDPYLVTLRQTWSVSQFNGARAIRLDHEWTRKAAKKSFEKRLARSIDTLSEAVHSQRDWRKAKRNYNDCHAFGQACPMLAQGCQRQSLAGRIAALTPSKYALKVI